MTPTSLNRTTEEVITVHQDELQTLWTGTYTACELPLLKTFGTNAMESRNGKKVLTSCSEAANNENSDNIGKTPHLAKISINSNSLKVRILER